MRFRMLGPLEFQSETDWTSIGTDKPRSLFACLLLNAGQVVPSDALVFELWGDTPPLTASNLVSVYVHQLRRTIGDPEGRVLAHRRPGYHLATREGDTDLQQFESLLTRGRGMLTTGGDAAVAAGLLTEAEGLWRGRFMADVAPSALVSSEAERAAELRLSAMELRIEADLKCDRHAETIPELRRLVAEHPLRERLWLMLMRALSDAGRHAESVSTYGRARAAIAEHLGVDPGPELQQFYAGLITVRDPAPSLRGVHGESNSATAAVVGTALGAVADPMADNAALGGRAASFPAYPAQLPADISDFTGRSAEVDLLKTMLTGHDVPAGSDTTRVAVVVGAAGAGKTALAVHAAHQVRSLFPDGQLYADLRGASATPEESAELLARFLRDLGVQGDKVPASAEERAALYRTRLSDRRVLVVLDNAKDSAQIRPLLPGSASCAAIVTSRDRTLCLLGSGFIDLSTLPRAEALALFCLITGDGRAAAEPEAVAQILDACGGLPLAVRICAARLATRGQWQIAALAERLTDERRRLDELHVGDLEVRGSFKVSYDSLTTSGDKVPPASVFRMLGLWPGQRISLPAATALVGGQEAEVAVALETLVDANLLESPEPDSYQAHDLLHLFGAEQAQAEDTAEERHIAVTRLLGWYLRTATAAADVAAPYRYRIPSQQPPLPTATPGSTADALAWFDREQANVIAVIRQAAGAGLHEMTWQLATVISPLWSRRGNWAACITANRIAVDSARSAGNRWGEAWALRNLGHGLQMLGDMEAFPILEQSLSIRQELGDLNGIARVLVSISEASFRLKGPQEGYDHSLRHLKVLRQSGDITVLADGLNTHGEFSIELGRLEEATECFQEALAIMAALQGHGLGYVLKNLGRVHLLSGRTADGITSFVKAHRHFVAAGHLMGQAQTLKDLGQAQHGSGLHDPARESLTAALILFEKLQVEEEIDSVKSALVSMETHVGCPPS